MNRTEALALGSAKAAEKARLRRVQKAVEVVRDAGWVALPSAVVVRVDNTSQFQRDVTVYTVEVPNAAIEPQS